MSSKIIIVATIILLLISFSALFAIEVKNHDYDYKKSWSVVYFENPRDDSFDFIIENHLGNKLKYDYRIFLGDDKVIDDKIEIEAGGKQKISPEISSEKLEDGRITIIVISKDIEYKIYKNIQ